MIFPWSFKTKNTDFEVFHILDIAPFFLLFLILAQNIDTLETQAGVQNVIQCHGTTTQFFSLLFGT